jgi:beta-lactamase regulating signal transducer with metallopeptidase domain
MSTQIASLGPLCQAAIITFKPFSGLLQFLGIFLLAALLLKLVASFAKTFISTHKNETTKKLPVATKKLLKKYAQEKANVVILNTNQLIAFSSVLPVVANGIFLSKGLFKKLTPKQQEAVFLHELYHWQAKETFSQLLLKLLSDLFFFLPIFSEMLSHWQLQSEISADAFAVKNLRSSKPLKQALEKWLDQKPQTPIWAVAFAETQLTARIDALNSLNKSALHRQLMKKTFYGITSKNLAISLLVITSFLAVTTSSYAKTETTIIIPTNTQCSRLWNQSLNQSEADAIMSPKLAN